MPIAAAVVPDARVPAVVALLDMAAQCGGAALRDRGQDAPVRHWQRRTHVVTIGVAVAADHVRHRRRRAIHRPRLSGPWGWGAGTEAGRGAGATQGARGCTHLCRGDRQVPGRRRETPMAEQQLNGADVGAGFQEVDGERVAQQWG